LEESNFCNYQLEFNEVLEESAEYKIKDIKNILEKPGIYFLCTKENDLLYVGRSINVKKRINDHIIHKKSINILPFIYFIRVIYDDEKGINYQSHTSYFVKKLSSIETIYINTLYPIFNKDKVCYQSFYDDLYKNDLSTVEKHELAKELIVKYRKITGVNKHLLNILTKNNYLDEIEVEEVELEKGDVRDINLITLEDISEYLDDNQKNILGLKQAIKYINNLIEDDINKMFVINILNQYISKITLSKVN